MLYGYTVIVENAVRVSERPQADGTYATSTGSSPARAFVKDPYSAAVLSRPGGVNGQIGAPSYSTIQRYYNQYELTVRTFDDAKHEYTDGHVNRDSFTVLAAPATGFLVTNILAPEA
jgi:hypothetical protein